MSLDTHCPACGAPIHADRSAKNNTCKYCGSALPPLPTPAYQAAASTIPQSEVEQIPVQIQSQDLPSAELDDTFQVAADALRNLPQPAIFRRWRRRLVWAILAAILVAAASCICLFALINQVSLNAH